MSIVVFFFAADFDIAMDEFILSLLHVTASLGDVAWLFACWELTVGATHCLGQLLCDWVLVAIVVGYG